MTAIPTGKNAALALMARNTELISSDMGQIAEQDLVVFCTVRKCKE